MSPAYAELVALAERELDLVRAGRLDDLQALQERRAELVSSLPAAAPPEALPLLRAAAAIQAEVEEAIERDLTHVTAELQAVRRGRHAVQAYTPGSGAETRLVDSTG